MKNHLLIVLILAPLMPLFAQINPQNIEIVRDAYGVPHIYAKTDAEVAMGLLGHTQKMTLKPFNLDFWPETRSFRRRSD